MNESITVVASIMLAFDVDCISIGAAVFAEEVTNTHPHTDTHIILNL